MMVTTAAALTVGSDTAAAMIVAAPGVRPTMIPVELTVALSVSLELHRHRTFAGSIENWSASPTLRTTLAGLMCGSHRHTTGDVGETGTSIRSEHAKAETIAIAAVARRTGPRIMSILLF
jgi:hypothetical protein